MNNPSTYSTTSSISANRSRPTIWLVKEGEPLPIRNGAILLRAGRLANALEKAGCNVLWISASFDHGTKTYCTPDQGFVPISANYQLYLLKGAGYKKNAGLARVRHQLQLAREFTEAAPRLPQPDLILAAYPTPELCEAAARFATKNGIPLFVDVRDPWPDSFAGSLSPITSLLTWPLRLYYRSLCRRALQRASGITAMSEAILHWALSLSGRTKNQLDKVFFLSSTMQAPNKFLEPRPFSPQNPLCCLFFGSFGRSHDGESVLTAARHFQTKGEDRVQFLMVGDGDLRGELQSLARDLANVKFLGWASREHALELLTSADLGIVSLRGSISKWWLGNKLFEYLGCGLGILNNSRSDVWDWVETYQIGINFDEEQRDLSLASAVEECLRDPKLLSTLKKNATEFYDERLTSQVIDATFAQFLIGQIDSKG